MDSRSLSTSVNPIMGIMAGYWQTRILLTAVDSEVFTELSGSPATAPELSRRLRQTMPGTRDFLLGLTGLGLLELRGDEFANSPVAERFLVRARPDYLGGYLRFCEQELNPAWDGLGVALRTGKPQNRAAIEGNPYDTLYSDEEATHGFLVSMDLLNTPVAFRLSNFDWSPYRSFVDVGGARGNLAQHVVVRHPHLTATVFDLPRLESDFIRHMAEVGAPPSISFSGGDFFTAPLPEADVLIFGHVLHNWGEQDCIRLLRNAHNAVRSGGAVFIYDPMISDGIPPVNAVLTSLAMLVWTAGGHEYSVQECHRWLSEAGFRPETAESTDPHDDVLIIGHKDT